MDRHELQAQQRTAETVARKAAMALAVALARNPTSALLAVLVETAAAFLEVAELCAATMSVSDADIISGDLKGDATAHLSDLLCSGVSFEEARIRVLKGLDDTEAGLHTMIAKREADAWLRAEAEISVLLGEAGLS
jgi:hypothetical protein